MHITNQLIKSKKETIMKMRNNFAIFSLAAHFLILNYFGVTSAQDVIFQEGNALPQTQFSAKPSGELADNRIGTIFSNFLEQDGFALEPVIAYGIKHVELTYQENKSPIDYSTDELSIPL